jgi:hypothetical protein
MLQGLEYALSRQLNDILSLHKPDGRVFERIAALVSQGRILITDVRLPIETGDRLIRNLPSGLRDEFIVDDPGFQQGIAGLPAHYQVKVHRAALDESKPKTEAPFRPGGKPSEGIAEVARADLPSWKEFQNEFLQHAVEHTELRAVWTCVYTHADQSAQRSPQGQWIFSGGLSGSQHLFREIVRRAAPA